MQNSREILSDVSRPDGCHSESWEAIVENGPLGITRYKQMNKQTNKQTNKWVDSSINNHVNNSVNNKIMPRDSIVQNFKLETLVMFLGKQEPNGTRSIR